MFGMFGLGLAEVIILALIGGVILVVVMRSARGVRSAGAEVDLRAEVERLYDEVARLRDQIGRCATSLNNCVTRKMARKAAVRSLRLRTRG